MKVIFLKNVKGVATEGDVKAVKEGYLVDYHTIKTSTTFMKRGIKYAELSEEQKEEYENKFLIKGYLGEELLNKEDAVCALLKNDLIQNFVWDKLWRRKLFDNICFPVGRTYEDLAIVHRLFERAEVILCLPEAKYHYLQRPDSIVGDISLQNR